MRFFFYFSLGYTPFPFERPTGNQTTQQRIFRPTHCGSQQKATVGTKPAVGTDHADPAETAGAHTSDLFTGSEALQDRVPTYDRRCDDQRWRSKSTAAIVPGGVAGQQSISSACRQTCVTDDITHPAQLVA